MRTIAFCVKLCVAAGSPLVFVPDEAGKTYMVLTPRNAVRIAEPILDQIGVPGIVMKGKVLEENGLPALAVEEIEK
jgi:hypothetical protein